MMQNNEDIRQALLRFGVVTEFELRMVDCLKSVTPEDKWTEDRLKVYLLYFSFLRDGSTRLPLDKSISNRWEKKLSRLQKARLNENNQLAEEDQKDYDNINNYFADIVEAAKKVCAATTVEPMVIEDGCLYTRRALNSKQSIVSRFGQIFSSHPAEPTKEEIDSVIDKYKKSNSITLDSLQAKAICKGRKGSLIITGGPGTGKTTVVAFLLKELEELKKELRELEELKESGGREKVFLVAPSGKAADRLKESICESFGIPELPEGWQSMTIHRLLAYNPKTNSFSYNKDNQFNDDTIFVVDESSMIDLNLFAALLEAIPDKARVYLLGDKDQLPSVDSGAVLGEILATAPKDLIVELETSQRFKDDSEVGRLALAMQKDKPEIIESLTLESEWKDFDDLAKTISESGEKSSMKLFNYPVATEGSRLTRAQKQERLEKALSQWKKKFCQVPNASSFDAQEVLKQSRKAKILSAENGGVFGVDNINRTIVKLLRKSVDGDMFEGEHVMVIKNMSALQLFNGDTGIIAKENGELVFKKDNDSVPLRLIPSDCITVAYATTIHKAQGSGYDNVLLFLPENKNSLLATRQILYTGITRVKKGMLCIVGSKERFDICYQNTTVRDTGINLNSK
jgi:exodeoxyribonuclease V alpha subunit